MNALRSRYFSLRERVRSATPRERLMLAALAVVGVLILLSLGLRLARAGFVRHREVVAREEKAGVLLREAPAIDAMLSRKIAAFAGKRLSASDFLASVDALARESGLNAEASTPRTERTGGLVIHRVRVNLRAASLQKLMDFDDRLRLRGDGLVAERVSVESRSADGELAAVYELAACRPSE